MPIINKDDLPVILAIIVAVGFISLLWLMAWHEVPAGSHDLLTAMTGVLGTGFGTLIGYYFGSSAGSAKKTEIMQQTQQSQADTAQTNLVDSQKKNS